jgi:hypothetical protein
MFTYTRDTCGAHASLHHKGRPYSDPSGHILVSFLKYNLIGI